MVNVFLNGRYIGEHKDPASFIEKIKEMRRNGNLPTELNVAYYKEEDSIYILTDKGRARRPLIVVKDGKPLLTKEHIEKLKKNEISWDDLVKQGVIEYLDAEEEENAYIALDEKDLTPEHTHLEISPTIIMGPQANMVPYAQHSLSYRITLGAKMTKQALGLYTANVPIRADTDVSIIHYSQIPIVKTQMYDLLKVEDHPIGQNVVVAIMPFDGYNIQDAIVINKGSIERGLFRATTYRPYKCEELRYPGGQTDIIKIPDKDIKGYRTEHAYRYLEEDGIIVPEAEVGPGDVLVGKVSPPRFLASLEEFRVGTEAQRETSTTLQHAEQGIVESVLISESEEGNKFVKVKVRDERIPELGDKFASRHGQKGVVGLIVPEEDMPFTADGIIPDIIFSPHSIPTRMTVSHLIEVLGGKVGALYGKYVDATAFQSMSEFELRKMLKEAGFREDGSEIMYDGRTGEEIKARIFIGSQYYYRLKHMVANKIHARSRGPVQLLTRQPTEGRAKEGGLRLGEMEKDCLVGHGASLLLKERFDSDKTVLPVCKKCGLVAIYNKYKNKTMCPVCGENAPVTFVEMSYAFKLLLDELKSMGIYPKLKIKPKYWGRNMNEIIRDKIGAIEFRMLSPKLIKKMAVVKVITPELYDADGYPIDGSLMDLKMGVIDPGLRCRTCGGKVKECPGHFGYIELARPVFHIRYIPLIYIFLRSTCSSCGRLLLPQAEIDKWLKKMSEVDDEKKAIITKIIINKTKLIKKCPHCGAKQLKPSILAFQLLEIFLKVLNLYLELFLIFLKHQLV